MALFTAGNRIFALRDPVRMLTYDPDIARAHECVAPADVAILCIKVNGTGGDPVSKRIYRVAEVAQP